MSAERRSDSGRVSRRDLLRTTAVLALAPPFAAFAASVDDLHGWRGDTAAWVGARLAEAERAVAALTAAAGARTIANTLHPYDQARNALTMAANQAQLLASAGATPAVRAAAGRAIGDVDAASVRLDLDPAVYRALRSLATSDAARAADPATRRYIDQAMLRGRLAGADRDAATRAIVLALRSRIVRLGADYQANMQRSLAALGRTPATPSDDAEERRRRHVAYENVGYPANAAVLADLLAARGALARALGYDSYADLTLADQMIASAAEAQAMLDRIDALSRDTAAGQAAEVRAYAKRIDPSAEVTAADATYWTERYRRDRFGVDAQAMRAFLPFARVLPGVMDFAARFFGVRFVRVGSDAAWHPDVAVFDVRDAKPGSGDRPLGRIYLDAHPRAGKDAIFATAPLIPGIAGRQRPEGVILCNLPGGEAGDPGLLALSDVVSLTHEFGHLMHHVLAGQGRWSGQGAFDTEEDFLETPSQMLEEFVRDPAMLGTFARHHATGEPLSPTMIAKLTAAAAFGRAGWLRTQLQRARFALAIHRAPLDAQAIEAEHRASLAAFAVHPPVEDTHAYAGSPHLIGYGPNYYMYLLDKATAVDLAARFPAGDAAAGATADRYRRIVLEPGAGRPARALVRDFLGRDDSLDALSAWMRGDDGRS